MKEEIMWAVYDESGNVVVVNKQRRWAIKWAELSEAEWRYLYRRGYRVIRVRVTPEVE